MLLHKPHPVNQGNKTSRNAKQQRQSTLDYSSAQKTQRQIHDLMNKTSQTQQMMSTGMSAVAALARSSTIKSNSVAVGGAGRSVTPYES